MSENRNENSPSDESSAIPEVNFGAVAPTKPYAGAPVEIETFSREAGSAERAGSLLPVCGRASTDEPGPTWLRDLCIW